MLLGAHNKNMEAQGLSLISKILFGASVLAALFIYYLLLSYRQGEAQALTGELNLNNSAPASYEDGSLFGFLFGYFGAFTYILPLFIIYFGYVLFIRRINLRQLDLFSLSLRLLGFNLLVIGCTSTFSFCFNLGETGGGGILGDFLNIMFKAFAPGAMGTIVSILIVLTGLSLFVAMSPLALIDKIGATITSLFTKKDKSTQETKSQEPIIATAEKKDADRHTIANVLDGKGAIPSFKGKISKKELEAQSAHGGSFGKRKEPVFDSEQQSPSTIVADNSPNAPKAVQIQPIEINDSQTQTALGTDTAEAAPESAFAPQTQSLAHDAVQDESPQYISPRSFDRADTDYTADDSAPSTFVRDNTVSDTPSESLSDDEVHTIIFDREEILRQKALEEEARREAKRLELEREEAERARAYQDENPLYNADEKDDEVHSIITDRSELTNYLIRQGQEQGKEVTDERADEPYEDDGRPSTIITDRSAYMQAMAQAQQAQIQQPQPQYASGADQSSDGSANVQSGTNEDVRYSSDPYDNEPSSYEPEQHLSQDTVSYDMSERSVYDSQPQQSQDQDQLQPQQTMHQGADYVASQENRADTQQDIERPDCAYIQSGSEGIPSYSDVQKSFGFVDENASYVDNVISFDDVNEESTQRGYEVGDRLTSSFEQVKEENDGHALQKDRQTISEKDAAYDYGRASRGVFSKDESSAAEDKERENNTQSTGTVNLSQSYSPLSSFAATSSMDYSMPGSSYAQSEHTVYSYAQSQAPVTNVKAQSSQAEQTQVSESGYTQFAGTAQETQSTQEQGYESVSADDRSIGNNSDYKEGFVEQNSSGNNYPSYMQDSRVGGNESFGTKGVVFKSNVVTAPNTVYGSWRPDIELLTPSPVQEDADVNSLNEMASKINQVLSSFGVKAKVERYITGPVITRYELSLAPGIKSSAISSLSVDLSRSLMVQTVRVIDVIPGTAFVGIEVPNKSRKLITLYDVACKDDFAQSDCKLPLCLGCSVTGTPVVVDLVKAPHLLVAGTTGSGKSAGLNAMLVSMLLKKSPEELRLILIDPKRVEFSLYNNLPHLITPIISDVADKAAAALRWCVEEMERRYQLIETNEVRKLDEYNDKIRQAQERGEVIYDKSWTADMGGEPPVLKPLPLLVVVIEEYADLVAQTSGGRKKNENSPEQYINRLAAKARAAGIHLILATQSPRSDVLTGVIKNNIPARIAFTVQSLVDSRVILDEGGAEKLLGNGDMLCKFTSINQGVSFRCHGAFVCNSDVDAVVQSWREHGEIEYIDDVTEELVEESEGGEEKATGKRDAKLEEAAAFALDYYARNQKYPPISDFQIKLGVGYPRAKKIHMQLQNEGIIN